ncbi:MAG: tRNA uridine-5-carboxymethylaminomethyl(34) synthesis GTPase MnmE [Spirochaetales bacterium]|nr:tRNA uridine-5-carboxymethylaminomethyl(34) synthesis GTPase MnmE [Spirochaetales bacterium]
MDYGTEDPIAALATPPGQSAIAVIRISGKNSLLFLSGLFRGRSSLRGRSGLDKADGHTLHYGILFDPDGNEQIDQVVVGIYKAPGSYTGEDSAEIYCHGSMTIVKKILILLEKKGFRQALPGEFTQRAFLNGKIDLTRAEAVNDIIRAQSDRARALALNRLSGAIEERITRLKDELVKIRAAVEIRIDYPDEGPEEKLDVSHQLEDIKKQIGLLLSTYKTGRLIQEGITIVIAGSTNAGKSTLFNVLLREDRAIVSDIHGTTRDFIEGKITIGGIPIRLFDTAGLRKTDHPLELEGIRRTDKMIESADLLIYIVDAAKGPGEEESAYIDSLYKKDNSLIVWNKTDLTHVPVPQGCIGLSAKQGAGLDILHNEILRKVLGKSSIESDGVVIDSERQNELLAHALAALDEFGRGLEDDIPLDVLATCLQDALDDLGRIIGEITTAEMLEVMFSQFCVGK